MLEGIDFGIACVLVEPVDDGVVPEDAVVGLQHPVVFVGEVKEFTGNPLALQSRKGGHALGFDDAEIEGAVDDQHRGLPFINVVDGVVFGVAFGVIPWGAAVLHSGNHSSSVS